eukprot:XP_020403507.1 uncharacterized LOC100383622 isoform X1 [Zea mays]
MALPASSSGLFRFVSPRSRPQSTDIVAAASWGVFAGTAGLYLVQGSVSRPGKRLSTLLGLPSQTFPLDLMIWWAEGDAHPTFS